MRRLKHIATIISVICVTVVGATGFMIVAIVACVLGGLCQIGAAASSKVYSHSLLGLEQLHNLCRRTHARVNREVAAELDERGRKAGMP